MDKKDPFGPKAIAKRMKSKGLQKLRWYCQMCEKQCRDENGFKCHIMSEGHQRQLLLFGERPGKYMDEFSREFKTCYLDLLRRRFGGRRVHSNVVYQEYIKDKGHVHMNSTKWVTLTGFCQYLGREGLCKVEETEKGWYIQYIERDAKAIQKALSMQNKDKIAMDDEDRIIHDINRQIKRATESASGGASSSATPAEPKATELKREEDAAPLKFSLGQAKPFSSSSKDEPSSSFVKPSGNVFAKASSSQRQSDTASVAGSAISTATKRSALDEIRDEEERFKEKKHRRDYWLTEGIIVRLTGKSLPREVVDRKAVVRYLVGRYSAKVSLLPIPNSSEKSDQLAQEKLPSVVEQSEMETVVPGEGRRVKVVNGAYRGSTAVVKYIDTSRCTINLEIDAGPLRGRPLEHVLFEDVCRLHEESS